MDGRGSGYAGLNSRALLNPDFANLDMALVRGVTVDSRSARLIHHILDFAHGEGMGVIAEGIETAEELKVVIDTGCKLFQGYYFARPSPPFCSVAPVV